MTIGITGLVIIFAICRLAAWVGSSRIPAKTYAARLRAALVKLIGDIGWGALAAAIIILGLRIGGGKRIPDTIDGVNQVIASADGLLSRSWIVFLPLCIAILVVSLLLSAKIADPAAAATSRAMKWAAFAKALLVLLAATTFVSAEVNGETAVGKDDLKAKRARIEEAQLALFKNLEIVLLSQAVAAGADEIEHAAPPVGGIAASYADVAPLLSPVLASRPPERQELLGGVSDAGFRLAGNVTAVQTQALAQKVIATDDRRVMEDKLVADIVKMALAQSGTKDLKAAFADLGNPWLNAVRDAFLDPATMEPLRAFVAKQANRAIHGELDVRTALGLTRQWAKAKFGGWRPSTPIPAPPGDQPFGDAEWDAVRQRVAEVVDRGVPGKSPALQDEARAVVGRTGEIQAAVTRLVWASPRRPDLEETAFANYMARRSPAYAALWGFGVIAAVPPRLRRDLEELSMSTNERKAAQIMQALKQAQTDGAMADALRSIGFDPATDVGLDLPRLQRKLQTVHGAYPIDGYMLYSQARSQPVRQAREYFASDAVDYWVGRICPGG